jgi:hypothetical protein
VHLQLASGGCANRNSDSLERQYEHRYRLFLYFAFKNRAILGFRETSRKVWVAYRAYAFNRRLITQWNILLKRQFLFVKIVSMAAWMCQPRTRA